MTHIVEVTNLLRIAIQLTVDDPKLGAIEFSDEGIVAERIRKIHRHD